MNEVGTSGARAAKGRPLAATPPRYALADLIAQCDAGALPPDDGGGWTSAPPVDREQI